MKKTILFFLITSSIMTYAQIVGVGTINPEPSESTSVNLNRVKDVMLDVDGKVRIRTAELPSDNDNYSPVVRDNKTGVLKILNEQVSQKPFNYLTYRIDNPNEDWISNLDTQISTDKWAMAVIGFTFLNRPNDGSEEVPRELKNVGFISTNRSGVIASMTQNYTSLTPDKINNIDFTSSANVEAVAQNGTWRLEADYAGSGTSYWGNGYWVIKVLLIDRAYINVLNDVKVDLKGSSRGMANLPADLSDASHT